MADRVWVVDDDEAMRDSLRMLLQSAGLQTATYPSAQAFLDAWRPGTPGCLLLDIRMPGMSGLELQAHLADTAPPIVFITGHGDVPMAVQAMQRGAADFLQKPFNDQALIDTVSAALSRDRDARIDQAQRAGLEARRNSLTPREREVMVHVVAGTANKVIALELALSQRTVEVHRARVMEKMGATTLAELVRQDIILRVGRGN